MKFLSSILSLFALTSAVALGATPAKRWLHGVVASQDGEPILFVEYPEPYGGLPGEYFWLQPAEGLEAKLKAATREAGASLHVLAEVEGDYRGPIPQDLNGFLFEAKVLEIGTSFSQEKPAPVCEPIIPRMGHFGANRTRPIVMERVLMCDAAPLARSPIIQTTKVLVIMAGSKYRRIMSLKESANLGVAISLTNPKFTVNLDNKGHNHDKIVYHFIPGCSVVSRVCL